MDETQTGPEIRKERYDLNFKCSAVGLCLAGGKSAEAPVTAEQGISGETLKAWKQQLAAPVPLARRGRVFARIRAFQNCMR